MPAWVRPHCSHAPMRYALRMKKTFLAAALLGAPLSQSLAEAPNQRASLAPAVRIESAATAEKLELIRRFMIVAGIQSELDSGRFLERYALSPEFGWIEGSVESWEKRGARRRKESNLMIDIIGRIEALKAAYKKYRPVYQTEYEKHLNWEFTEDELRQMVDFFDSPVGKHYLDGIGRIGGYIGTNMEETEKALVAEAVQSYRSR